ncbi:hypothetical protein [Zhongshania sp.]|uniref:hypothetical protein n=1 Tax=Zhongshania sp. TaxID=1971902 RepID=UPI003568B638
MDIVKKQNQDLWVTLSDRFKANELNPGDVLECRNLGIDCKREEFYVMVVDGATMYSVVVLHNGFVRDVEGLLWYSRPVKSAQLVIESE